MDGPEFGDPVGRPGPWGCRVPPRPPSCSFPPGGSDSNPGTETAPFATPNAALRAAQAGDTVTLRGGTYTGGEVRVETPNLTIRSYPGELAVLHCPDPDDITLQFRLGSDGSRLEGVEVTGAFYGIKFQSNWDWGEPTRYGAGNITISGCRIHDTGNACIKVTPGCDDITVEGCEIYNSGVTNPGSAEAIDNVNGDRMTVRGCYFHDIRGTGVYAKGGAVGMVIDRCLIVNCDEGGVMVGFDTSPEWFDLEANPNYYENIDGLVTNCIIVNTQYAGIGLYAALNAQVYNNTIINTAQDGHAGIYFGLTYQDWEPQALRPPSVNPTIRNNIVVDNRFGLARGRGHPLQRRPGRHERPHRPAHHEQQHLLLERRDGLFRGQQARLRHVRRPGPVAGPYCRGWRLPGSGSAPGRDLSPPCREPGHRRRVHLDR